MNEETKTAIESIGKLLNEASKMSLTIERMLEIEARLAVYIAYTYQEAAKAQAELNACYWIRKVGQSKLQIKARNSGAKSAKDAENLAMEGTEKEIQAEIESTRDYELLHGYCKGTEKVLISLAHRIKNLEAERARNTQHVRT